MSSAICYFKYKKKSSDVLDSSTCPLITSAHKIHLIDKSVNLKQATKDQQTTATMMETVSLVLEIIWKVRADRRILRFKSIYIVLLVSLVG